MQILYSRCCGIDVHKNSVTACVLVYTDTSEPEVRKREFATHKKALGNLRWWLHAQKVTHVAMESTGVYWKPVWQALESNFELTLANPYQIKTMPGRKTDARDSQWIAELLAHGLIRRSFVPPPETRNLRDLTRYRVKLVEEHKPVPAAKDTDSPIRRSAMPTLPGKAKAFLQRHANCAHSHRKALIKTLAAPRTRMKLAPNSSLDAR